MPATVTVRWMEGAELRTGGADDLERARASGGALWVDVLHADRESLEPIGEAFGLHPLAIEDCLHEPQRVKIDTYPEAAFVVWLLPQRANGILMIAKELDIFLGSRFLITSRAEEIPVVDEIAHNAASALAQGAEWTLHSMLDRGVDELFPVIDRLADTLDDLEDTLLGSPVKADLERLTKVKRALVATYRIVSAERDVLRGLSRYEQFVSREAYLYFQDVGDHLARAVDSIDTYRDVASSAMDLYLSSVNNRMNEIMKQLTVVATIFMPLTLMSGIYGMNLLPGMWPPFEAAWSFMAVIGSMVAITVGMLWFFKRRSWW